MVFVLVPKLDPELARSDASEREPRGGERIPMTAPPLGDWNGSGMGTSIGSYEPSVFCGPVGGAKN